MNDKPVLDALGFFHEEPPDKPNLVEDQKAGDYTANGGRWMSAPKMFELNPYLSWQKEQGIPIHTGFFYRGFANGSC